MWKHINVRGRIFFFQSTDQRDMRKQRKTFGDFSDCLNKKLFHWVGVDIVVKI